GHAQLPADHDPGPPAPEAGRSHGASRGLSPASRDRTFAARRSSVRFRRFLVKIETLGVLLALVAAPAFSAVNAPPAKPDSDKPWKIEDPHGASKTVAFTTDEGTWLSLDV